MEEVGARINETYGSNLLSGANGPKEVLDDDLSTFKLMGQGAQEMVIETNVPITINRLAIQEAINTHSERVEKHALDAWVDNAWKEIATATNIGYKRILRFPEVTTQKLRIRILESRFYPAIASVSAHYYKARPPRLSIERSVEGAVTISPKKDSFGWKPHGEDVAGNINSGYNIRFTTDGSEPTAASEIYHLPFNIPSGEVKAVSEVNGKLGSVASQLFGIVKKDWKPLGENSIKGEHSALNAFDGDPETYWSSVEKSGPHFINIDLGKEYTVSGFTYTPQTSSSEGMIEKGVVRISADGKTWKNVEDFQFGNLINDPTTRTHMFKSKINARYIGIESKVIAGNGKTAAIAELDFLLD